MTRTRWLGIALLVSSLALLTGLAACENPPELPPAAQPSDPANPMGGTPIGNTIQNVGKTTGIPALVWIGTGLNALLGAYATFFRTPGSKRAGAKAADALDRALYTGTLPNGTTIQFSEDDLALAVAKAKGLPA